MKKSIGDGSLSAVISVPENTTDASKDILEAAASKAGLPVLAIMS